MKFRIVRDKFSGYEIQARVETTTKSIFFPWLKQTKLEWKQISGSSEGKFGTSSFSDLQEAENYIHDWLIEYTKEKLAGTVVKEVEQEIFQNDLK
jgi:hypothetical protein